MPWVARLINKPKLTGGFDYVVGHFYIVRKPEDTDKMVYIIDQNGKTTKMGTFGIREYFTAPKWIPSTDIPELQILKNLNNGK